jgi:hypothetical protein
VDAPASHGIERRCLHEWLALQKTERIIAMVISQNEDDVAGARSGQPRQTEWGRRGAAPFRNLGAERSARPDEQERHNEQQANEQVP